MLVFGIFLVLTVVPIALIALERPPEWRRRPLATPGAARPTVLGWPPNLVSPCMALASFCCCIPMAMPQSHLVALCSDLGIKPTHGAAMLSLLLGIAFFSPPDVGLDLGPHRRPHHGADRLDLAVLLDHRDRGDAG